MFFLYKITLSITRRGVAHVKSIWLPLTVLSNARQGRVLIYRNAISIFPLCPLSQLERRYFNLQIFVIVLIMIIVFIVFNKFMIKTEIIWIFLIWNHTASSFFAFLTTILGLCTFVNQFLELPISKLYFLIFVYAKFVLSGSVYFSIYCWFSFHYFLLFLTSLK